MQRLAKPVQWVVLMVAAHLMLNGKLAFFLSAFNWGLHFLKITFFHEFWVEISSELKAAALCVCSDEHNPDQNVT